MRVTHWTGSIVLAVAVYAVPAMAAGVDVQAAQTGNAAATVGGKDGCPVHEGMKDSMHKAGEPCPMMQQMGKMHEGCDMHGKKDCMEKNGEPCLLQHDKKHMSMQHEACATLKDKPKPVK